LIFWKAEVYFNTPILNSYIISITYKISGELFVVGTIISLLQAERVIPDFVQGGLGL
jgi:hypothetical protein